ncbi:MAG TPA: protein kinase [Firmicutes bacterium]|nr:protein kinase [Bacillota bacterium]
MLEKGTVISKRYQIIEKLGAGGMAVAYKARDMRLGRFVTVKVLKDEYSENDDFLAKFSSEASAAASLSHHNIVRVYDVGEDRGINYIVMEYVHGESLKKTIEKKAPFDTLTTLSVAMQIASALSHAHKHHVVHRDIKPQNILVSVDGTVKVTDFGIARAATANTYAADVNAMGSVHYFSPEQARGGYVNEKSDIYSLGITMFEMATGKVPFDASSSIAIALKHLNEELPDIKQYNPNVTRGLEGIIRKATQKKADERYDNIDLMISDIKLAIIEAARIAKSSKAKTVEKAESEIDVPQFKTSRDRRAAEDKPVINDAVAEEIAEKDNDELEGQLSLDDVNGGAGGSEDYDDEYDDGYDEDYDDYDDEEPEDESSNEENEIKVELAQNIKLPKRSVGFDKYSKKLKLNNENDSYDDDYDDYDDDYDDDDFDDYYREFDEEKRQERRVTIAAVITAFVIIGIIVFVGVKFFNVFENAAAVFNRTETVPKFVGMTMTDAEEQASSLGIRLIEGAVVDSTEPADTILTQDVEEGTEITDNMEIMVTVSSGADMYELPNVVGEQESDAISKITSALNANIIIEYEYDETHQEGEVIKQSPEGNTMVSASSDVVLTICRDQDSINAVVPKVEGYTEEEAIEKIEASGLTVGNISRTTSTSVASGYVITQTAEPGEEILKNSPIDIVVSIGRPAPQPVDNTPDTTTEDDTEPAPIGSDTTTDTGTTDQGATQTQPNTDNTGTSTDVADDVPALGSME